MANGIQAGRLSIEIVAEIARLQQDLDRVKAAVRAASGDIGRSAKAANDNLAAMGRGADASVASFGRMGNAGRLAGHHVQNLSFQLNDMFVGLASGQKPMTVFMQQGTQIAQIMGQAGIGVKGLVTQLGGMAAGFAAAHPVLVAFAVAAAASAAAIKVLAVELSRDNKDYLQGYANGLKLTKEQLEKAGGAGVTFMDVVHGIGKTISDQLGDKGSKVVAWLRDQVIAHFNSMAKAAQIATSAIYAGFVGGYHAIVDIWKGLPGAIGDVAVGAANGVISALNMMLAKGTEYVNRFIGMVNPILAAIPGFEGKQIPTIGKAPQIGAIANPFSGQARALVGKVAGDYSGAFNDAMSAQSGFMDRVRNNSVTAAKQRQLKAADLSKFAGGKGASSGGSGRGAGGANDNDAGSPSQEAIDRVLAMAKAIQVETDERKLFNNQLAQGLLTAEQVDQQMKVEQQLRPFIIALSKAEGEEKKKLSAAIELLRKALKGANDEEERGKDLRRAQDIDRATASREKQAAVETTYAMARLQALRGLNGEPLEQALRAINLEEQKALIEAQAQVDIQRELALGHDETAAAIRRSADQQKAFLDEKARWDEQTAAVARMKEQVDALGNSLGNALQGLGGLGGGAGQLFGALLSNNPRAALLGMGGAGTLAGLLLNPGALGTLSANLSTGLYDLGLGAKFSGTAGKLLAGAGVGSIAGGLTGSSVGGALGGAAGNAIGSSISALGSFGGPIGSIVGGLLGGIFGGLFKSDPQAVISLSNQGGKAGFGNLFKEGSGGDEQAQLVQQAGGNISSAINQIVGALGGKVTDDLSKISIGTWKKQWAVNDGSKPGFRGLAAGDPGATVYGSAEEAIAAAIRLAIRNATTGLSDQVKNLISAPGTDLETQLAKAQAFQAVMQDAATASQPLAEALKALQAQFSELDAVFAEAGATTEQLAQLTKYESDQRKALIGQFTQFIQDNFTTDAEKLAKASADVAAEMERLGYANVTTKAQFKALADSVDTTSDAGVALLESLVRIAPQFLLVADAADQAQAAAAELAAAQKEALDAARLSLTIDLLRAQGRASEALALERSAELAAMEESLRPLQALVWAWQDAQAAVSTAAEKVSAAQSALSAAYERQASELDSVASRWRSLASSMRSYRQSLTGIDSGGNSYSNALVNYLQVSGNARAGNEAAIGQLQGAGQALLGAAAQSAGSSLEYNRTLAMLRRDADAVAQMADGQASAAEMQAQRLKEQVSALIELNEKTQTVAEAIEALKEAQAELDKAQADRDALTNPVPQLQELNLSGEAQIKAIDELRAELVQTRGEIAAMRGDTQAGFNALDAKMGTQLRLHQSWDAGAAVNVATTGDVLSVNQV